jgi:inositol-hexakisphosphate 5-kinase
MYVGDDRRLSSTHQYYRFPLSPPSSEPSTALSSPYIPGSLLHPTPNDSDGYMTESSSAKFPRKSNRALTLPAGSSVPSPSKSARTRHRRSNSTSSSASASSETTPENNPPHSSRGRKVAATLQLFKETAVPSDDSKPGEPSSLPDTTIRQGSYAPEGDVAEAQFEFVKRSEWPDREAAAVRRKRSSTALERVRTRESNGSTRDDDSRAKERKLSTRDGGIHELAQWRKDVSRQETGRGRRRERTADDIAHVPAEISASIFHEPPSSPRSRAYPPSPSPSRPPTRRISQPADPRFSPPQKKSHRSLTPIRTHPSPGPPPYISPWSTDDESAWETGSAATSTTSTHPPPLPSSHDSESPPFFDTAGTADIPLLYSTPENGQTDTRLGTLTRSNSLDLDLPHIPLRPFRNQVGGHSAIYKFTKQAVCKVCSFLFVLYQTYQGLIISLLYRGKISFMSLWSGRHPHFSDSFRDIWVLCLSATGAFLNGKMALGLSGRSHTPLIHPLVVLPRIHQNYHQ